MNPAVQSKSTSKRKGTGPNCRQITAYLKLKNLLSISEIKNPQYRTAALKHSATCPECSKNRLGLNQESQPTEKK